MREPTEEEGLPKPFYRDGWTRQQRPIARALWHFHLALTDPYAPSLDGSDLTAYFTAERDRVLDAEALKVVPSDVAQDAYAGCAEGRIPIELLAAQVAASETFSRPARFADSREVKAFVRQWAGSHARALAHLARATGSWQLRFADEMATGLFWVGRLMTLKDDLARDRLFIPLADLEQHGVPLEQLRAGRVDENMKRLLWKQTIRAKNAFAHCEQLANEVPSRQANALKRWWLGGLEILNEIQRRKFDLWSEPIELSLRYRLQVRFQARFGRTTFRA
ncbi:MAG: squalene/phytoene synthase family protein [Rhodothermales bacterium]